MNYLKAIVAVGGAAVTAALGLVAPNTTLWQVLTILSVGLTALGVYAAPNKPKV